MIFPRRNLKNKTRTKEIIEEFKPVKDLSSTFTPQDLATNPEEVFRELIK